MVLIPLAFSVAKQTKKSTLYYAILLLFGLASGYAFVPPSAGSVLVANTLGVNLGTMIMVGVPVALICMLLSGIIWGGFIGNKIFTELPAIAHELGIEITGDTFDRLHRNARYLLDVRPAGRWPAECFYYAGGVPAIMEEIKEHLHLDVMTVTGKTLGENLEELKHNGFYEKCEKWLQKFNSRYNVNLTKEDIIRPYDKAIGTDGSIAVLRGNLAPEGAVIKHTACPKEMFKSVLRARPFDSEEECLDAVLKHKVQKGDAAYEKVAYEVADVFDAVSAKITQICEKNRL